MSAAKTKKEVQEFVATGRRKTSSARVRIKPGTGKVLINGKELEAYCYHETLAHAATQPLRTAEKEGTVDVSVRVGGGGPSGQAGAIAHGLARALEKMDEELRSPLKKAGHLTRDGRAKERKKPGKPGARKSFQFSKR